MDDSLWIEILDMFNESERKIKICNNRTDNAVKAIKALNVTCKSALGAVLYNTTGVVVDDWIRIWGHDDYKMNMGIETYNEIDESGLPNKVDKMLIIANDVVGGLFAINAGKFGTGFGEVWYFAPDTLEWESLEMKYAEFLAWTVQGDIDGFYDTMRWNSWRDDCVGLKFNEAILVYPFLWSNEIDIETADKSVVPFDELFSINQDYREKFNISED